MSSVLKVKFPIFKKPQRDRKDSVLCPPLDQKKNKLSVSRREKWSHFTDLKWQLYPRSGGNELRPRSRPRGPGPGLDPPRMLVKRLHMPGLRVFSWPVSRDSVSRCRDNVSRQVCSMTPLRRSHNLSASSATEISENWTLYSEANLLPSLV